MHHALQIQEILLNMFGHCHGPSTAWVKTTGSSDLPTLARTCRAFKDPALDVLWEKLLDLSPIAQCVPEACHLREISEFGKKFVCYSFSRPLIQTEWNTLRSYTRRIRCITEDTFRLDWESVATFLNPLATEPLFPNLRILHCSYLSSKGRWELLCMPFPSLVCVHFGFNSWNRKAVRVFHRSLESLSEFSPHIRRISILWDPPETVILDNVLPTSICRWQNLQSVECSMLALDADAIVHLSRMPALTHLNFGLKATLPDEITPSNSFIYFSNLRKLDLQSESIDPISRFLCRTRLPAVTDFDVSIQHCPSKLELSSFWTSLQTSGIARNVQRLFLEQRIYDMYVQQDPRPVLLFEDLLPCTAFSSLRYIHLEIEWNVNLTSNQLLTFASTWPRLDTFSINTEWGWNADGGITPDDLLQLLYTCRSLGYIGLSIDMRGYTEFSQSQSMLDSIEPRRLCFNVADSRIRAESVKAITMLLIGVMLRLDFSLYAWRGWGMMDDADCMEIWSKAYREANRIVARLHESVGLHRRSRDC